MSRTASSERWLRVLADNWSINYAITSMLTVLLCDILLHFADEVRFIWRSRKSFYVVLYWIMRYLPPLTLLSDLIMRNNYQVNQNRTLCVVFAWSINVTHVLIPQLAGEALMMMRIWVLWDCSRGMLIFLAGTYLTRAGFLVAVYPFQVAHLVTRTGPNPPGLPGCLNKSTLNRDLTIASAAINVITATIVFLLTVTKFLSHAKRCGKTTWCELLTRRNGAGIFEMFLQDASFYVFCVLIAEIIFAVVGLETRAIALVAAPFICTIYSLSATHLVLSLRKSARKSQDRMVEVELPTFRSIILTIRSPHALSRHAEEELPELHAPPVLRSASSFDDLSTTTNVASRPDLSSMDRISVFTSHTNIPDAHPS